VGGESDEDESEGYDEDSPSVLTARASFLVVRGHSGRREERSSGGA
jgi:hypothetical protein